LTEVLANRNEVHEMNRLNNQGFAIFFLILAVIMHCPLLMAQQRQENEVPGNTPEQLVTLRSERFQKKVRKKFGPAFRVCETDHFRVISDTSLRYQCTIAGVLEQFYREVHPRFFHRKMKPIVVYLIHGGLDFEKFVTKYGHGDNKDCFGFYSSSERALYARRYFPDGKESGVGTIFHETVHAMVHADFRRLPSKWFNEGLASLFERCRVLKGKLVYGNPNPWREARLLEAFEAGLVPKLEKFLTLSDSEFRNSSDEMLFYHTARSLFLYLQRSGEDRLVRFVDLVRKGKPGPTALKMATGIKLEQAEKKWHESIRTINFAGSCIYHAKGDKASKFLMDGFRKCPDYGYLRLKLARKQWTAGRKAEALKHAQAALEDPRLIFPTSVYTFLGFAYGQLGQKDKAIEAFETAISYQPWLIDIEEYCYERLAALLRAKCDEGGAERTLKQMEILKIADHRDGD
jgi:tetratricopeptide (TPR) repeat protein